VNDKRTQELLPGGFRLVTGLVYEPLARGLSEVPRCNSRTNYLLAYPDSATSSSKPGCFSVLLPVTYPVMYLPARKLSPLQRTFRVRVLVFFLIPCYQPVSGSSVHVLNPFLSFANLSISLIVFPLCLPNSSITSSRFPWASFFSYRSSS
jgi:hypothetical protein